MDFLIPVMILQLAVAARAAENRVVQSLSGQNAVNLVYTNIPRADRSAVERLAASGVATVYEAQAVQRAILCSSIRGRTIDTTPFRDPEGERPVEPWKPWKPTKC